MFTVVHNPTGIAYGRYRTEAGALDAAHALWWQHGTAYLAGLEIRDGVGRVIAQGQGIPAHAASLADYTPQPERVYLRPVRAGNLATRHPSARPVGGKSARRAAKRARRQARTAGQA